MSFLDWPTFRWDHERLAAPLAAARHLQGRLIGQMEALGFKVKEEAVFRTLTDDVLKSSVIEGEMLDPDQVRSSVARRLGMDIGGLKPADRHVEGVVEMMLDATQRYEQPLTEERLFGWHASLFPTMRSGMHRIKVAAWRDDSTSPMQVVSGPVGRERVHFEAPVAARLGEETRRFFNCFESDVTTEPVLKAALAHVWFVTIHPTAMAGLRGRLRTWRWRGRRGARSGSTACRRRSARSAATTIACRADAGGAMDITPWMEWFLGCLTRAIDGAQTALSGVIAKARYWEKLRDVPLNDRQGLVINRLLEGWGATPSERCAAKGRTSSRMRAAFFVPIPRTSASVAASTVRMRSTEPK